MNERVHWTPVFLSTIILICRFIDAAGSSCFLSIAFSSSPPNQCTQDFAAPLPPPEMHMDPSSPVPMSMGSDHGDLVATMAVGDVVGVANRANLVAVKTKDEIIAPGEVDTTIDGTYDQWRWMLNDIKYETPQRPSRVGKSVINYSFCKLFVCQSSIALTELVVSSHI